MRLKNVLIVVKDIEKSRQFYLDSPSVRNTKHYICDNLRTSDQAVIGR